MIHFKEKFRDRRLWVVLVWCAIDLFVTWQLNSDRKIWDNFMNADFGSLATDSLTTDPLPPGTLAIARDGIVIDNNSSVEPNSGEIRLTEGGFPELLTKDGDLAVNLIRVQPGQQVEVVRFDRVSSFYKVKIMTGQHANKIGYVSFRHLR